ncbi:MAG: hypothetical protein H6672_13050 [Anaerolineaceae bacterium]|nr:hypothetical protein [Anaerolineaceae bacterium]
MSRKTRITAIVVTLIILALSASLIYAQGNGNGNRGANGNGRGNQGQNQTNQQAQTDLQGTQSGNGGAQYRGGQDNAQGNASMNQGGANANQGNTNMNQGISLGLNIPASSGLPLTDEVIAAMYAGILDEYHAFAVYQAIIDQFGSVSPFVNIQASEASHIATWESMFERYGLTVPEVPTLDVVPQFTSLSEACATAAAAEIANFGLYDAAMETFQDYPDLLQVVTTLRNASEFNHLPAFETCAG